MHRLVLLLSLSLLPSSLLAGGFSDAFGYQGQVSTTGGPEFAFPDISATGTTIPITTGTTDDGAGTITLAQPFPLYGAFRTQLRVSTNGYLSTDLTDGGNDFLNDTTLPTPPDNGGGDRIYVLHDDLNLGLGAIHYQYFPEGYSSAMFPNGFPFRPGIGVSIIQWTNVSHLSGDTSLFSFQALLFDDGSMYFSYPAGNPETGSSSTTGIQNVDLSAGMLFYSNTPDSIPPGFAIVVTPPLRFVTTKADSGPGSLRQAIADSPLPATITFAPSVFNRDGEKTIPVTSGPLAISGKAITIDASAVCGVTLQGNDTTRVIENSAGSTLVLDSLNITGGNTGGDGAGINTTNSNLTIHHCGIYNNVSAFGGGGIAHTGSSSDLLRIRNSTLARNTAVFGGGLLNRGAGILTHVTIAQNTGTNGSAGIVHEAQTLSLGSSIISNSNSAVAESDLGGLGGSWIVTGPNLIRANNGFYTTDFPSGATIGTSSAPVEPMLVSDVGSPGFIPLINNGGPTRCLMPRPGSPAIDAGTFLLVDDQRGISPVGNRDLGAVETTWGQGIIEATITARDVTSIADTISTFPLGISHLNSSSQSVNAVDNDSLTTYQLFVSHNMGMTITPALGATTLEGLTIHKGNSILGEFVLLGSNDLNCFHEIASFDLPNTPSGVNFFEFQLTSPPPPYLHYRLYFTEGFDPFDIISVAEVQLLGTPLITRDPPTIIAIDVSPIPESDPPENTISLTYTIDPGIDYDVSSSTPGLQNFINLFTALSTPQSHTNSVSFNHPSAPSYFFKVMESNSQ